MEFYLVPPRCTSLVEEMMEKKILLEKLHNQMTAEIQNYAIILLDIDDAILSWNKGAAKIKGYKES